MKVDYGKLGYAKASLLVRPLYLRVLKELAASEFATSETLSARAKISPEICHRVCTVLSDMHLVKRADSRWSVEPLGRDLLTEIMVEFERRVGAANAAVFKAKALTHTFSREQVCVFRENFELLRTPEVKFYVLSYTSESTTRMAHRVLETGVRQSPHRLTPDIRMISKTLMFAKAVRKSLVRSQQKKRFLVQGWRDGLSKPQRVSLLQE